MTTTRAEIDRVVRSVYAARVADDLDGMMRHFSDAPHFSLAGSAAASPIPLAVTGAAAIREVMRRLVASFEFVEAEIVDARDVSGMSIYPGEGEWLLPPGGKLVVASIEDDSVKNPGKPKATAWKRVKMRQVLS